MLYSDKLEQYNGELPIEIRHAIAEIGKYFGTESPEVLRYDDNHIVVPVVFDVSLPSRGAVNDLDIRPKEPMLIKFNIHRFPNIAPITLSDRENFPRSSLSHLYFTKSDQPASLCLVRNNLHEWFSKIRLDQYLTVVSQWLYKAATNQLDDDGGEFDPFRLEHNGTKHLYRYSILNDVVVNDFRLLPDFPFALFAGGQIIKNGNIVRYQTTAHIPFIALEEVLKVMNDSTNNKSTEEDNPILTPVFWSPEFEIERGWPQLPQNYGELKKFFRERGINLHQTLLVLAELKIIRRKGFSIIYAMKRPCKLIGYDGEYEFLNFFLTLPEGGVGNLTNELIVSLQSHSEPLTVEMANFLSGRQEAYSSLYIGAGSLGAKAILHDARSGNINIAVCDNDTLLPHNLARHSLASLNVGRNKAEALVEEIKSLFPATDTKSVVAVPIDATRLSTEFQHFKRIVDTTASKQVLNYMVNSIVPGSAKYFKAEIADEGALGLFYTEGPERNPRMDDLVNWACYLATEKPQLQLWRQNDTRRTLTTLNVGLGCNSTTTVMSDDTISFHASFLSRWLQMESSDKKLHKGGVFAISCIDEQAESPVISSERFEVDPFTVLNCQDGSGWELRMKAGIEAYLLGECNKKAPKETGGVLVGIANYKTKTIHVFDIISEPQGSYGTYSRFVRGNKGLPAEIDRIKDVTGGIIGYIGEWHSHPMNLKTLSAVDREAIGELRVINQLVPIPTCSLVVTPDELLLFVQE